MTLAKLLEEKGKVAALEAAHQQSVLTKGKDAKATGDLEIKVNKAKTQLVAMEQDDQVQNCV